MSFELFRSSNLRLSAATKHNDGDLLLVTFSHWWPEPALEAAGFAEDFAAANGIDVLCWNCASNAWWQYPEMPEALAAAASFASGWSNIVTYGSSMGAYAALRFASALGARRAVAISPQYSIDPSHAPWETRYTREASLTDFSGEGAIPAAAGCEYIAVYDPLLRIDVQHVSRIEQDIPLTHIRLPVSGHPALNLLLEAGMLSQTARELIGGSFDRRRFIATMRERRRLLPYYWLSLSLLLQDYHHFGPAIETSLIHALLAGDKAFNYRWAFARAARMGSPVSRQRIDSMPEPDRTIAAGCLAEV